ncbi:MAG: LVIVD repeat-containing protein [uncultured bacterium]|nr:MAG: LVIVD repeat-containing protein [uncultured bacterium]
MLIKIKDQQGLGIIEIIVAVTLFVIVAVVGVATVAGSYSTNRLGTEETQATIFAQSGLDAVRSIKKQGWDTNFLITDCSGGCGLGLSGNSWVWSGTENTQGVFTRYITVSDILRDGSGNIVTSGGNSDPDTRRVESSVTWNFSPNRNNVLSLITYLTNYAKIIPVVGGWANPISQSVFDLTNSNSGNNNADAISLFYLSDFVFLGRTSSGGTELYAIDVSDLSAPDLCTNCQLELGGSVNDVKISGNYAYIASTSNSQELQIVNVSNPTSLNTAGVNTINLNNSNSGNNNADAISLEISGNSLYMIRAGGNEFIEFNVSTPTSPTIVGTDNDITGTPTDMVVVGGYAFITSTDNNAELQVVELSSRNVVGTLNLNEGNNAADALSIVYAGNDRILVGRDTSQAPELYSINISSPTSPTIADTAEIVDSAIDLSFGNELIFIATDNNSSDLLIIDGSDLDNISDISLLTPALGFLNVSNSPQKILYESLLDRLFIASSSDNNELEIIRPQ